jgi:hypothetical protein
VDGTEAVVSEENRLILDDAIERHLPEAAVRHIDRSAVILTRSTAGTYMLAVESYDRELQPLKANIGTREGDSVDIRVDYEDGRWHRERWVDGNGEIVDGQHHQPELWAGGF